VYSRVGALQTALDALLTPGIPTHEMLRRITGMSQPVVAAPADAPTGGIFGRGASRASILKPVASFMKDATSVLVRLHDGQLTGMLGIAPSAYSTDNVPTELRSKYTVSTTRCPRSKGLILMFFVCFCRLRTPNLKRPLKRRNYCLSRSLNQAAPKKWMPC
jgi:hypothetical protein